MPRYFFNSVDGQIESDDDGVELPDEAAAHAMAMHFAGEMLQSDSAKLWKHGQWRVEVSDAQGALLFTVITLVVDAVRRPELRD